MFVERIRNADGSVRRIHLRRAARFLPLDAALDFAEIVQIIGEPRAIANAQALSDAAGFLGHRIQNAALGLDARLAIGSRARSAEKPLENGARIDFHGQRRGWRAPGNGVQIGAAKTRRAAANVTGKILGGHFERRQRRVLADLLRHHLVDGGVREHVFGFGPLGPNSR